MPASEKRLTDSLLERARGESKSALNLLLTWCRPELRRRAMAQLARPQDASDMVQECQLRGATGIGGFEGRSLVEFRAWIGAILDNIVLEHQRFWGRRKRDRKREQPLAVIRGGPHEANGSATSVLERLARREECERLIVAAGWCREEDRAVIDQHLFAGKSHEQIAAEWGVSSAVARQRFSRAVRRVGEASRLLALMSQKGVPGPQQQVIGIHRFQGVDAATIATRLQLPRRLVARWLAQAAPLYRELDEAQP